MVTIENIYDPIGPLFGKVGFTKDISESVIGVEFENETKEPFEHPSVRGWQFQPEGSLRYCGFEYVLKTPVPINQAKGHIQNLFKWIDTRREAIPLTNSIRTSTHVHFDVTKWTYIDLLRFSTIYWILEETLSSFCGETRKGNLFCLRLKDASYAQNVIAASLERGEIFPRSLTHNDYRYASLNFSSVSKFGSIEFRMMRGVDKIKDIYTWIDVLEKIKTYSFALETPLDVREAFLKKHDASSYAKDILGEALYEEISSYFPKDFSPMNSVRDSFLQVSPIFSAHKTWDFKEDIIELKKKREEQEKAFKKLSKSFTASTLSASNLSGYTANNISWDSVEPMPISPQESEPPSSPLDPDYGEDNVWFSEDENVPYMAPLSIQTYSDC